MWYELLYLLGGGTVGFLGGALMAGARRGDEHLAARSLVESVRGVVDEFHQPQNARCPHPCCQQVLRLALEEYDGFQGVTPQRGGDHSNA